MAIKFSDITGGGIPFGNTAGRPANPGTGKLYSNGEAARLELYTATGWQNIVQEVPGVASITGTYSEASNSGTITIAGTNFVSGAIASAIGANGVEVLASSTTYNSLVQLTAVFTGLSNANEPYDIKVTNPSNLFGLIPDALYVNASPVWVTSAGSLGTFTELTSITLSALSATDSDSTITYALASGSSLPSGVTLNSSTGVISGTLPDISTNTTYSFTINASDGVNTIPRAFSITSNALIAISTAETLVVAGGGGGGSNGNTTGGGGGGAGGYLYNASTSFTPGTVYTLSIGTGGVGRNQSTSSPSSGSKGGNSQISGSGFTTITAFGGGGGVSNQSGGKLSDADGGSGGGGNYVTSPGTGVSGQGNAGGGSENAGGNNYSFGGGGGGGSAAVGSTPASGFGGNGGAGTANSITGTSLVYAAGGGAGVRNGYTAGSGGSGIGGSGKVGTGNGENASPANRGSGGGGGGGDGLNTSYIGGSGSDGVIIIAYPNTVVSPTISGTLTYDQPTRSGYRVYRFTAGTGTITF